VYTQSRRNDRLDATMARLSAGGQTDEQRARDMIREPKRKTK
jgi:hypothetical protein